MSVSVWVSGEDRTADLGREIADAARARAQEVRPGFLSPQHSALQLKDAADTGEYQRIYNRLIGMRFGIDTAAAEWPSRRGLCGRIARAVQKALWKLLRHQHERMAYQQNLINELLVAGLEFQRDRFQAELDALKKRLEEGRPP